MPMPGTRERLDLFTALRIELAAHAAAEERFLYVPILMDDRGLDSSRHALHEHHEIDELVEDLQSLDPRHAAWLKKARELSEKVHHHLREEEKKFFQVSVVNDYSRYHVRHPPRGYHWVRDDRGNLLMVAIATGIIADLLLHH